MRSETYVSKINLQRGKLTVENRKSREKKTDMLRSIGKRSGESVESVQEKKRWEGFAEKESFKPGEKEWRGDGWWEWWVDGTNGGTNSGDYRLQEIAF